MIVTAPDEPPQRAAAVAARRAAPTLQPLPPLELAHTRPAGHDPRAALTRPPHPGRDPRPTLLEREILTTSARSCLNSSNEPGVGPIVAAQLIVTWSHHDRVRSEAAFARLAGVAPLPASSGLTTRHRLSRGGDRQLNRALHTSSSTAANTTQPHATTSPAASPKAKQAATPPASSSATSPATSTASCRTRHPR